MKVIFLDIDGVLNSTEDWIEAKILKHPHNHGFEMLNRAKLAMLVHIVQETGAKLVLSSTWRLHYSNEEMMDMFCERGCHQITSDILIDQTPRPRMSGIRGHDIASWLKEHPEVTQYIILDDSSDFFEEQLPYHVKTDTYVGLTFHHVRDIIKRLNGTPEAKIEDAIFDNLVHEKRTD